MNSQHNLSSHLANLKSQIQPKTSTLSSNDNLEFDFSLCHNYSGCCFYWRY